MAVVALTPRVRTIVVCDDISASMTEDRVFTLEGVRFEILAPALPCRTSLFLFLALSSPRKGVFPGRILLIDEQNEKALRYIKFAAEFEEDNQLMPYAVDLGACDFPSDGLYRFEVYFSIRGAEALKGEHPITVICDEE
jgi:hypothetical protein